MDMVSLTTYLGDWSVEKVGTSGSQPSLSSLVQSNPPPQTCPLTQQTQSPPVNQADGVQVQFGASPRGSHPHPVRLI